VLQTLQTQRQTFPCIAVTSSGILPRKYGYPGQEIMERIMWTFLEKVVEVSSYPPSEGKEEVRWRILIRKSGLAEGYTMPSNYPSARPDLRIKIRHRWNLEMELLKKLLLVRHKGCCSTDADECDAQRILDCEVTLSSPAGIRCMTDNSSNWFFAAWEVMVITQHYPAGLQVRLRDVWVRRA